jgi:hypothetical protein
MTNDITGVAYPLEEKWRRLKEELAAAPMPAPTGFTRDIYLDIAERIIRTAIPWQDETGTVIDPYKGEETNSCTARFVGTLGQLIAAGRCHDLIDACIAGYEACLLRLDEVKTSPEFWTKELMYAHRALKGKVPDARIDRWNAVWETHDPRSCYRCMAENLTVNSVVFALAGEYFKHRNGLIPDIAIVDELMSSQRNLFTPHGMYRDPKDPITYDLVVRQQLDLIRSYGYQGTHLPWLEETSRRGALTALLYQSSVGQAPFGGRSNQFLFVEAHFACMCESHARFYAAAGDHLMAGIFKRAGRRAVSLTLPWIMNFEPYHHTKQGFSPSLQHGVDSGGFYSIYGILMGSLCGTAYHLADEEIEERLIPSELGGYTFGLWPDFHKVFATGSGYHLEIDTCADLKKDATGLGRFHRLGVRPEAALSGGIAAEADYTFAFDKPVHNLAIGPAWTYESGDEHRLADHDQIEDVTLDIQEESVDRLNFSITYNLPTSEIIEEHYELTSDGLRYTVDISPKPVKTCILIPIISTDGDASSTEKLSNSLMEVTYRDAIYRIQFTDDIRYRPDPPAANRNAFYKTLEVTGNTVTLQLSQIS